MSEKNIIKPEHDTLAEYIGKVWKYKPLIITFAKRDLKVKYAQTVLGIVWTIIQPTIFLLLFSFFFGYLLKWETGTVPFPIYVYSGMLGWNFFSYIVMQGNTSLQESAYIIKKIYFPKLILPLSKVIVGLLELSISFVLLIILMIWYGYVPSWKIIFLPVLIFINIIPAITLICWVSALSYRIRDLHYIVPFFIYIGIWITPVFFTNDILPDQWKFLWYMNPMSGIIEGWRWCLFSSWSYQWMLLPSTLILLPLCLGGIWLYSRNESLFSDFA